MKPACPSCDGPAVVDLGGGAGMFRSACVERRCAVRPRRIKAGLYVVGDVYVRRETHMSGTNRRAKFGGARHTYEDTWFLYEYYDEDSGRCYRPLGATDFGTLKEAKEALRFRPGKLGTHSSATFQVLGSAVAGNQVLIRSDMDDRCNRWQKAIVDRVRDDGFVYLSFL